MRKTDADEGIEELTASIAALGVLQSLVVRKTNRGKYAIIAGRRRYRALPLLAEARNHRTRRAGAVPHRTRFEPTPRKSASLRT